MRYFAEYDDNGKLIAIGVGDAMDGVEITREEYEALAADIALTFEYADKVYRGEMTIADVPERLRENVQEQVDMLIADVGPFDPDEITDEEALAIIRGASV